MVLAPPPAACVVVVVGLVVVDVGGGLVVEVEVEVEDGDPGEPMTSLGGTVVGIGGAVVAGELTDAGCWG